jgi:hypothetical protein
MSPPPRPRAPPRGRLPQPRSFFVFVQRLLTLEREGIALLLMRRAQDAGEHLLRGPAVRRAVAAADLAGHHRGADRLLGLPNGGRDVGAREAGEQGG